jgi:hypothetical protein
MSETAADPARGRALVEEFRRQPIGRHSPDLRLLLNDLRRGQKGDPYILICTRPHAEWRLARKPPGRGTPVRLVPGHVFRSPEAAEWEVFKLLWKESTGETLT